MTPNPRRVLAAAAAIALLGGGVGIGAAIGARSTSTTVRYVPLPAPTTPTTTPGRAEVLPPTVYFRYGPDGRAKSNTLMPPATIAGDRIVTVQGQAYPPPTTVPPTTPTTSPAPTTTTTTTVPATTAPPPPAGLAFDSEFNGTALDTSQWTANWLGNPGAITKPSNGSMTNCQDPADVTVSGGYLHLAVKHVNCTAANGTTYPWSAGLATTFGHFTFTTGHAEARVFLPGTTRILNWPGVWTDGTGTWPATGESDIMEGLGGNACWHYHGPSPAQGSGGCAGALTGWHTFGETIEGGQVQYQYDGKNVGSPLPVVNAPHYFILQESTGGETGGDAEGEMLVDYVRISTP